MTKGVKAGLPEDLCTVNDFLFFRFFFRTVDYTDTAYCCTYPTRKSVHHPNGNGSCSSVLTRVWCPQADLITTQTILVDRYYAQGRGYISHLIFNCSAGLWGKRDNIVV